jgi:hypothetical protein
MKKLFLALAVGMVSTIIASSAAVAVVDARRLSVYVYADNRWHTASLTATDRH